jgi:hypothetical protein
VFLRRLILGALAAVLASSLAALPATARDPIPTLVSGVNALWGVDCRGDATCVAVGATQTEGGATMVFGANGSIGPQRRVPATDRLNDVTCLPGGNCLAAGAGRRGAVVAQLAADGTPVEVRPVVGATTLTGIACPTTTTCLATGERVTMQPGLPYPSVAPVYVVITNGEPGPALRYPRGTFQFTAIDCPTDTTCLAIGGGPVARFELLDGVWAPVIVPASARPPRQAISCPSAQRCYAITSVTELRGGAPVGFPAITPVRPDGVSGPAQRLTESSGRNVYGISCVADGSCTLVGTDSGSSRAMVVDVRPGEAPAITLWYHPDFYDVSCITRTACGIVGSVWGSPRSGVLAWRA